MRMQGSGGAEGLGEIREMGNTSPRPFDKLRASLTSAYFGFAQ